MHALNVKLTYLCVNHCKFCFASHMGEEVIPLADILHAVEYGYKRGCRSLIISGGEPTLLPNDIMEVISYADYLGYESYMIQTNGIGLVKKNPLLYFLKGVAEEKDISIAFSVHGHTSNIHDVMSSRDGAFLDLVSAIENVSENINCNIYTNSIISTVNIGYLSNIVKFFRRFKIRVMQFAIMHTEKLEALSVDLITSAKAVHMLAEVIDSNYFMTEGIPYCMMYGLESCVSESYKPSRLDLLNKRDHYICDFDQVLFGMRKKASFCQECIMNDVCLGVWAEHYRELLAVASPIC